MKSKPKLKLILLFLAFSLVAYAQPGLNLQPGIDRWKIKTTAPNFTTNDNAKPVSLKKLIILPLLAKEYSTNKYSDTLIPKKVETLTEGDIISTKGYLHLVALENSSTDHRDGDYHIQLTLSPTWGDSCFIVEIPYEEFVSNPVLKALCSQNRSFIRNKLLHNDTKQPSTTGNIMQNPVYVKITGQLFYDAIHASQMRNPDESKRKYRGKKGRNQTPTHSYTAWEIHPVTNIEFVPKPQ
jgi:hypothetical protein